MVPHIRIQRQSQQQTTKSDASSTSYSPISPSRSQGVGLVKIIAQEHLREFSLDAVDRAQRDIGLGTPFPAEVGKDQFARIRLTGDQAGAGARPIVTQSHALLLGSFALAA